MALRPNSPVAADYSPDSSRMVRRTCLEIATRLGDFKNELCVVGGMVPSLIVAPSDLPEGETPHVGTMDLDLGFSVAVLDGQRYEEIARRLANAGFEPDKNQSGNPTAQRWKSTCGVTVDFLIPPSRRDDEGGRLRNLDENFAAFIVPGLDLAFKDSVLITIADELPRGGRATREIRVCGPGSFVLLKGLAFGNRASPKDAYDLYYVLRHHHLGARSIGKSIGGFGEHSVIAEAIETLRRDFTEPDLLGPTHVANFFGGPDEDVQADTVGFVREFLSGSGR